MSILYPTPGELTDRLTILDLKRKAAGKTNGKRFDVEIKMLGEIIRKMWGVTREEINTLAGINRELWRLEDLIRQKGNPSLFYGTVAILIACENDKRSRAKTSIDAVRAIVNQDPRFYKK